MLPKYLYWFTIGVEVNHSFSTQKTTIGISSNPSKLNQNSYSLLTLIQHKIYVISLRRKEFNKNVTDNSALFSADFFEF